MSDANRKTTDDRAAAMSRRDFLKVSEGVALAGASANLAWLDGAAAAPAATPDAAPARWKPAEPPNEPIGEAQGILPGRVVWIHDPEVAQWDGDKATGGWFENRFTNAALAESMLSRTLRLVTGATTDADAWAALFRHYNQTHGRGTVGYRPGEKVAVKLNLNCSTSRQAETKHGSYNTPQLTMALLRQLVRQAGVRESDLVVYDASRFVNDSIFLPAHAEFPGIRFEDRDGGDGRFAVQPDRNVALHFGDPSTPDHGKTFLPACVTGATYLVNASVFKGHSLAAVTLATKNHFGSVFRDDPGPRDPHKGWNPSHMHESIMVRKRPMGTYNALVDLLAHKDLGGKTIFYLIDAFYATPHQSVLPEKWQSSPFDGHWTSSVFASQDPVALESVAVDFFAAEATAKLTIGAVDNYLHEAALAHQPPSGIRYDPAGDGTPPRSLGVHEHWNRSDRKQYSRNLGTGMGIELVKG